MKFPTTAIQLGNCVCTAARMRGRNPWCMGKQHTGIWRAWLDGFDPHDASVTWEHRRLWVNLNHGDYCFELARLHEDCPGWSWRQQLEEKSWANAAHFALIAALVALFPAKRYAPVCVEREAS